LGELVVRLIGGVHALFGIGLFAAGIGALADDAPGTVLGWIAAVLGGALVAWMIATGLRLGLGDPVPGSQAAVMILATLLGGLTGAFLMQLPAADIGR
jgi:hypothetical protein